MKKTLLAALSIGSLAGYAQQKPNIILFLVDDMGWQDCSLPFHTDTTMWNRIFKTPNMERLAAKGMKFTNAYASSVSSPSRVSLITGVNPTRHKVTNWTLNKNATNDGANKLLSFEQWNVNGFSPVDGIENSYYGTSLPQLLKEGGYSTLFVGKAHFGAIGTPAEDPLKIGFDRNVAGHAAGAMGSYLGERSFGNDRKDAAVWGVPDLEKYHGKDVFLSEALTLESMNLMDEALAADKPFFLYMAHYAVHAPFEADKRFYQKYIDEGLEEQEARFASIVEGMDKSLGDIMDYTEKKGIDKNTIIIFMSDNGGYSVGVRLKTFNGINKNAPLRGGKGSLYEGGIREPMIVYAPNVTKAGSENNSKLIIEDFFPTILEMAGVKRIKTVQELDSKSFINALSGTTVNKNRPFFWHYPNDWGEKANECGTPRSAIIVGDMKLIHNYETATNELYNIKTDIGETNNLLGKGKEYDKVAQQLAKILSDKLRAEKATMPIIKSTGERCKYPDQTLTLVKKEITQARAKAMIKNQLRACLNFL